MTTALLRSPLKDAIALACSTTIPNTKERKAALKAIRWVLSTPTGYGACTPACRIYETPDIASATVFTGLDNEELKARFWTAQLGVECVPTLLP